MSGAYLWRRRLARAVIEDAVRALENEAECGDALDFFLGRRHVPWCLCGGLNTIGDVTANLHRPRRLAIILAGVRPINMSTNLTFEETVKALEHAAIDAEANGSFVVAIHADTFQVVGNSLGPFAKLFTLTEHNTVHYWVAWIDDVKRVLDEVRG